MIDENKVRKAIEDKNLISITFYKDGSGASFRIIDPTGDHGLPCVVEVSFNIQDSIDILKGFRIELKK